MNLGAIALRRVDGRKGLIWLGTLGEVGPLKFDTSRT